MRKTHFAISELLEMGLEILPNTVQGLYYKAKKENWLFRETPCQGGKGGVKREYALPPAVLDAIWQRRAAAAVAEGAYGQPEPCVAGAAYQGEVLDAAWAGGGANWGVAVGGADYGGKWLRQGGGDYDAADDGADAE